MNVTIYFFKINSQRLDALNQYLCAYTKNSLRPLLVFLINVGSKTGCPVARFKV